MIKLSLVVLVLASIALSGCARSVYGSYDDGPRVTYDERLVDERPATGGDGGY